MFRYPQDVHLEQPAFCSPDITKQELQVRINHYKMVLETYYKRAKEKDEEIQSCDPYKFRSLKAYTERRLKESEMLMKQLHSPSSKWYRFD
jgi:hypothetical protein